MNYESLLKRHHLKITPQRLAIIELMERSGHISIDDLYRMVRLKFASISLATLYKNVHTMMERSLIREVKIPGQKAKYEIEKEAHAHMLCKECGGLEDFMFDTSLMLHTAETTNRFKADDVSIVISGVCPKCQ